MGKASRRKRERRENGPGFVEAIQEAQRGQEKKFVDKFGKKVEVTMKDGELQVKPAEKPE